MRSHFALIAVVTTLALAALSAPAAAQNRSINVSGIGEVSVDPDMATIVIAVQADADSSAEALDAASAATAAILATLDSESIAPADIRSGAIRLSPRYNQSVLSSGNQVVGYQAINSIEVQVNNLDRLGGLIAALIGEGANRLDSVSFGLQDPSGAMDEARRRAVTEGARLAALYADAAGMELGDLITLSDGSGGGYRPLRAEMAVMESVGASAPQFDVPTAPGKIDLRASVNMVYAISD